MKKFWKFLGEYENMRLGLILFTSLGAFLCLFAGTIYVFPETFKNISVKFNRDVMMLSGSMIITIYWLLNYISYSVDRFSKNH